MAGVPCPSLHPACTYMSGRCSHARGEDQGACPGICERRRAGGTPGAGRRSRGQVRRSAWTASSRHPITMYPPEVMGVEKQGAGSFTAVPSRHARSWPAPRGEEDRVATAQCPRAVHRTTDQPSSPAALATTAMPVTWHPKCSAGRDCRPGRLAGSAAGPGARRRRTSGSPPAEHPVSGVMHTSSYTPPPAVPTSTPPSGSRQAGVNTPLPAGSTPGGVAGPDGGTAVPDRLMAAAPGPSPVWETSAPEPLASTTTNRLDRPTPPPSPIAAAGQKMGAPEGLQRHRTVSLPPLHDVAKAVPSKQQTTAW